jgi:hypothetical protein
MPGSCRSRGTSASRSPGLPTTCTSTPRVRPICRSGRRASAAPWNISTAGGSWSRRAAGSRSPLRRETTSESSITRSPCRRARRCRTRWASSPTRQLRGGVHSAQATRDDRGGLLPGCGSGARRPRCAEAVARAGLSCLQLIRSFVHPGPEPSTTERTTTPISTTDQPAPANPNKALWEKGDFTRIAGAMRESGEALVGTLGIMEGLDVLDLGCGDGTTAVPEAKLGANVLGVEISRPLVAAGNARAQRLGLGNLRSRRATPAICATWTTTTSTWWSASSGRCSLPGPMPWRRRWFA